MDKPLKPIIKLHRLALITSETPVIFVILLQPIVISNNPLIKAEQISLESPIDENKKQNMLATKESNSHCIKLYKNE